VPLKVQGPEFPRHLLRMEYHRLSDPLKDDKLGPQEAMSCPLMRRKVPLRTKAIRRKEEEG
jgi:hypothetical protein